MSDVLVVLVTGPDHATLLALGRQLVGERLAACVNVIEGVASVYRWEGAIEEADEALAIIKTAADRVGELESRVRELHPYDVPEFVALPLRSGSEAYLDWVVRAVSDRAG